MKCIKNFRSILGAFGFIGLVCGASEAPRGGTPEPAIGPLVEVTQKSGEINKGQLMAFAEGSLVLKLESGVVVTKEGASVVSLRFIAKDTQPTSAETMLTQTELNKLREIRTSGRKNTLSKEEEAEFKRLHGKLELHIKALERELPESANDDDARDKTIDLARSYVVNGMPLLDIRGMLKIAVDSIDNPNIRSKTQPVINTILLRYEEERIKGSLKINRPFEKKFEKMNEKSTPDKPADKPPEK